MFSIKLLCVSRNVMSLSSGKKGVMKSERLQNTPHKTDVRMTLYPLFLASENGAPMKSISSYGFFTSSQYRVRWP